MHKKEKDEKSLSLRHHFVRYLSMKKMLGRHIGMVEAAIYEKKRAALNFRLEWFLAVVNMERSGAESIRPPKICRQSVLSRKNFQN